MFRVRQLTNQWAGSWKPHHRKSYWSVPVFIAIHLSVLLSLALFLFHSLALLIAVLSFLLSFPPYQLSQMDFLLSHLDSSHSFINSQYHSSLCLSSAKPLSLIATCVFDLLIRGLLLWKFLQNKRNLSQILVYKKSFSPKLATMLSVHQGTVSLVA